MTVNVVLISELETALRDGSPERRVDTLRRVTDLFLSDSERLSDEQVRVFDDVLVHLITRIETKALVELSTNLAPVDNAPMEVVRRLAHNDELAISAPILTHSNRLTEDDLVQIAETKSQGHLLAISGRAVVHERLTDVLVRRGDQRVTHTLARNAGAKFSERGFATMARKAEVDATLAERLGQRLDISLSMLRELLSRATDIVRSRLLASAFLEARGRIEAALAAVGGKVEKEASSSRDYSEAVSLVGELNRAGKLNENVVCNFAKKGQYEEMVAVLALSCSAPVAFIERVMRAVSPDSLLVTCKAGGLSWMTVEQILLNRFSHHSISASDHAEAKTAFLTLSQAGAQRTLRFWLTQQAARKAG